MSTARSARRPAAVALAIAVGMTPAAASWCGTPEVAERLQASPASAVADAYGFDRWERIDRIDFTFRAELPNGTVVERPWSWQPEAAGGAVTLNPGTDGAVRFHTGDAAEAGGALEAAQRDFINDSYWLVFPFQLVWSDPVVTRGEDASRPISGDAPAAVLTAAWPAAGGFTPGDAYDLFLGEDGRIDKWVFRRAGGTEGRPATWEAEVSHAGVTFATDHRGPEGSGFRLRFPRLEVWADGADAPAVLRGD